MKRKMGRLTALFTAATMALSMFAGAVPVYADELTDDFAVMEEASDEYNNDAASDQLELTEDVADPDGEQILEAQEQNALEAEELPSGEDAELLPDDEDEVVGIDKEDLEAPEEEDIVSPDGSMNEKKIESTYGEVLRFFNKDIPAIKPNQHIYYGVDPGEDNWYYYKAKDAGDRPYWRVLDPRQDNAGGAGAIFVLSEDLWGDDNEYHYSDDWNVLNPSYYGGVPFSDMRLNEHGENLNLNVNSNVWQNSYAQQWCQWFYEDCFSDKEQEAIRCIDFKNELADTLYLSDGSEYDKYDDCYIDDNDPVFFLSILEVQEYINHSTDLQVLPPDNSDYPEYLDHGLQNYWLRTPSKRKDPNYPDNVYGYTYPNSTMFFSTVGSTHGARPAFNIEGSKILFVSEANKGKSSNGVGEKALAEVGERGVKEWRLTLFDSSRDNFKASCSSNNQYVQPGGSVKISYSGAKQGTNEYVSALLCDSTGKDILYYGRIARNSASGTISFKIPSNSDYISEGSTYKLMIFSEQYNGDFSDAESRKNGGKVTDLASDPKKFTFTIKIAHHIKNAVLSPTSYNYDGKAHIPAVKHNGNTLTLNTHYTRVITDSKKAKTNSPIYGGTFHMTLTGKLQGGYYGSVTKDFKIIPWNVSQYTYQSASQYKYDGTAHIPSVIFSRTKKALKAGTDYTYVIRNSKGQGVKLPVNAGSYSMTITGRLGYTGTATRSFKINPIANTLKVTKKTSKTFSYSASKKTKRLSKNKTITAKKLYNFKNKGQGKISYSLASVKKGSENFSTFFKVNNSNGKVTVRSGAKKGTYTVKVNVTAAGNTNYLPKTQQITFKIKIK